MSGGSPNAAPPSRHPALAILARIPVNATAGSFQEHPQPSESPLTPSMCPSEVPVPNRQPRQSRTLGLSQRVARVPNLDCQKALHHPPHTVHRWFFQSDRVTSMSAA